MNIHVYLSATFHHTFFLINQIAQVQASYVTSLMHTYTYIRIIAYIYTHLSITMIQIKKTQKFLTFLVLICHNKIYFTQVLYPACLTH